MTRPVRDLVSRTARRLADAGVASARADAETLLAHVLAVPRTRLPLVDAVPADAEGRLAALAGRRAGREPLQHLTGRAPFRHLELQVGPGVFVPRPETEDVAGYAVAEAAAVAATGRAPLVVDLCTGSGAIALAVATEVPAATVHAVEVDPAALAWAQRNAAVTASGDRVSLYRADVATVADPGGSLAPLAGAVDVVVANPPYVPAGRADMLDPEVRDHDPPWALFAGEDGLEVVRTVVAVAARLLRPGGLLVVEHDDSQGAPVAGLLAGPPWTRVRGHADLAGRPRATTARSRPETQEAR